MARTKTEDFGKKIGGARKDLWAVRGLLSSDLEELTEYEKKEYVKKDNIWKRPDYQAMLDEGRPREVIYFIKLIRDALPAKFASSYSSSKTIDQQYGIYIDFIQEIKNLIMDVKSIDDIRELSNYLERTGRISSRGLYMGFRVERDYQSLISGKLITVMLRYSQNTRRYLDEIRDKQFLYTDYLKAASKYDVLLMDDRTRINSQELQFLDVTKLCGEKYTTITSVYCQADRVTDGKTLLRMGIPSEDAARILDGVKPGEYLCFYQGKYLFKTDTEKEAFDRCVENHQLNHPLQSLQKSSNKKANYIPPQLARVDRNGPIWRPRNRNIDGNKMIDDFKFRGGEFGNWLNESDRQQSLNFCYDAFMDLSYALGMQPSDISFDGSLAIAFGARGRGGARAAVAHYEPERQVINLTKMRGAGSLGHEWIHAMDHAVSVVCGGSAADLATRSPYSVKKEIPEEFFNIIKTIHDCSEYMNSAKELDKNFSSDSQGYWSSDCELLARAGACWLRDRLAAVGIQNKYLTGHSEGKYIAPHGDERQRINQAFNIWIDKAKEIGFFNQEYFLPGRSEDMNISLDTKLSVTEEMLTYDPTVEYVQVSLFDVLGEELPKEPGDEYER